MRQVFLKRNNYGDDGITGKLMTDGFECYTLELPFKLNKKRISSIIPSSYICRIKKSPKFGNVYEIQSVKERGDILIHAGNFAGDVEKGYKTDSHGCILVGDCVEKIGGQKMIKNSKSTLNKFMEFMNGEEFILNIRS